MGACGGGQSRAAPEKRRVKVCGPTSTSPRFSRFSLLILQPTPPPLLLFISLYTTKDTRPPGDCATTCTPVVAVGVPPSSPSIAAATAAPSGEKQQPWAVGEPPLAQGVDPAAATGAPASEAAEVVRVRAMRTKRPRRVGVEAAAVAGVQRRGGVGRMDERGPRLASEAMRACEPFRRAHTGGRGGDTSASCPSRPVLTIIALHPQARESTHVQPHPRASRPWTLQRQARPRRARRAPRACSAGAGGRPGCPRGPGDAVRLLPRHSLTGGAGGGRAWFACAGRRRESARPALTRE